MQGKRGGTGQDTWLGREGDGGERTGGLDEDGPAKREAKKVARPRGRRRRTARQCKRTFGSGRAGPRVGARWDEDGTPQPRRGLAGTRTTDASAHVAGLA